MRRPKIANAKQKAFALAVMVFFILIMGGRAAAKAVIITEGLSGHTQIDPNADVLSLNFYAEEGIDRTTLPADKPVSNKQAKTEAEEWKPKKCPRGWEKLYASICYSKTAVNGSIAYVTRIDINDNRLDIGVLPTSSIGALASVSHGAQKENAIVAINASFVSGSLPVGPAGNNGTLLYGGDEPMWVFVLANNGSSRVVFSHTFHAKNLLQESRMVVSGSHLLVDEGTPLTDFGPDNSEKLVHGKHPRTALGVSEDGLMYFVVVDGRSAVSSGMSMPELAEFLAGFGVENAINLDGGGSSVKVVRGSMVNQVSDGVERSLSTMLMARAK